MQCKRVRPAWQSACMQRYKATITRWCGWFVFMLQAKNKKKSLLFWSLVCISPRLDSFGPEHRYLIKKKIVCAWESCHHNINIQVNNKHPKNWIWTVSNNLIADKVRQWNYRAKRDAKNTTTKRKLAHFNLTWVDYWQIWLDNKNIKTTISQYGNQLTASALS